MTHDPITTGERRRLPAGTRQAADPAASGPSASHMSVGADDRLSGTLFDGVPGVAPLDGQAGATAGATEAGVPPAVTVAPPRQRPLGAFFWMATAWLSLVTVCAVVGDRFWFVKDEADFLAAGLIADGDWTKSFSWAHPLGVDAGGNDWLSILTISARNSIVIAFSTIVIGFLIGGGLGMIAGYRKGAVDTVVSFLVTVLLSVPPLLFIILLVSVLSSSGSDTGVSQGLETTVWKVSLALGILSVPTLYRVVRGATLSFSGREFVLAARAVGAKSSRILSREILPNVAKPMLAYGLVGAGSVMVIEGSLSFLGVGVGDAWAWGRMIQSGASLRSLQISPHIAMIPAAALFFTVLSFNFVGDKIRERLEVKEGHL